MSAAVRLNNLTLGYDRHPAVHHIDGEIAPGALVAVAAYDIEFLAAQGVSTDAEASARQVAELIRQIRKEKVRAVFLENVTDRRLMQRIAKESRAKIGGTLYSDALSPPDGPAATYVDMMRHNIRELGAALTS